MIEEKENPEDEPERKRQRDPFTFELPEMDKPGASVRGRKRRTNGERLWACSVETTPICYGGGRDEGKRHAVVSTEPSHVPVEQRRARKILEDERSDKHEERKNDGDVCARWRGGRIVELARGDLDPILDIRPGNVEAKGIAGKECDILQEVAPWIVQMSDKRWHQGASRLRLTIK